LIVELRRVLEEGGQVGRAALLGDVGEVGRVVGAFAEDGAPVDADVAMPGVLTPYHRLSDLVGVGELGELAVTVYGKYQEHQGGDGSGGNGENAGLALVHRGLPLNTDA